MCPASAARTMLAPVVRMLQAQGYQVEVKGVSLVWSTQHRPAPERLAMLVKW